MLLGVFPKLREELPTSAEFHRIPGDDRRRDAVANSRRDFPEQHQPTEQIHRPDEVEAKHDVRGRVAISKEALVVQE